MLRWRLAVEEGDSEKEVKEVVEVLRKKNLSAGSQGWRGKVEDDGGLFQRRPVFLYK